MCWVLALQKRECNYFFAHIECNHWSIEGKRFWILEMSICLCMYKFLDDSFAGSMSTMAIIKLTTNRPIVNHPHYEDSQARERNKKAYSAFGRFPVEVIHQNMKELGAKYLLLEVGWCWAERPLDILLHLLFLFNRNVRDSNRLSPFWQIGNPSARSAD